MKAGALAWLAALCTAAGVGTGCGAPPPPARPEAHYQAPTSWLCLPGRKDPCARDLTATEIHPDGSRSVAPFAPATAPKADCFYVYPTVDMGLTAYNHQDFSNVEPMANVTLAQAARLQESCALYVPLYRQVSIGTYLRPGERLEAGLAAAARDVEAAFADYLARSPGRPIVLVGHSQGAEMVARVLRRFFDGPDAAAAELRSRLVVAMTIGGSIDTAPGEAAGGTFARVPLCTADAQLGCIVAYRTYDTSQEVEPGRNAPAKGRATACVNPADVAGNARSSLSAAYFPMLPNLKSRLRGVEDVTTPFVVFKDLYTAQCVEDPKGSGFRWLAVSVATGRTNPIDFDRVLFKKQMGLHVLDFQLPQGELLSIVARRIAALPPKS